MTNCVVLRSTEMPVKARVKGVWGRGWGWAPFGQQKGCKMWSDRRVIKSMSRNNKNCHFRLVLKFGPSGRRRRRQREWGRIRNLAAAAAGAVVAHINLSNAINQSVVNTQQKRRRRTHSTDDDAAAAVAAAACRWMACRTRRMSRKLSDFLACFLSSLLHSVRLTNER